MIVIPAIDILAQKAVRLRRGLESEAKVYSCDPVEVINDYSRLGAKIVHVVDLDSAIHNDPKKNQEIIERIFASKLLRTRIQFAGGIRSQTSATSLVKQGAFRIVIGSIAFQDPLLAKSILDSLGPEKVVLSLDYDESGFVKTNGWQKREEESALSAIQRNYALGFEQFLLTSIAKDGTLEGADFETLRHFRRTLDDEEEKAGTRKNPARIIASGGITTKEDLLKLEQSKVDEAIIGKAFYEGRLDPSEIIQTFSK
jgi:phosphoribosylformimino-5-aminoimidazole carboxamide ribotide isomerase